MPALLDEGVNVALGTDGMSSNDGNDMFAALKVAGLLHKLWDIDYERWLGSREAWQMATAGGAQAAGEHSDLGGSRPDGAPIWCCSTSKAGSSHRCRTR